MRRFYLFFIFNIIAISAFSEKRDLETARQIAEREFYGTPIAGGIKKTAAAKTKLAHQSSSYYAFNRSDGFVLVSADDRLPEIIGYSDNGTDFNYDSLPDNMRYWLASYDQQMYSIENGAQPRKLTTADDVVTVGPLMRSTWNQNSPFNDKAPVYSGTSHAASGCVATAASQIMYYWKYPDKGSGSHSYIWVNSWDGTSHTLSANFGATTYEWNKMTEHPTSSSDAQTKEAVATLLYHAGVACDMGYASNKSSSSGAVPNVMANAMKTYFKYDANLQPRIKRSSYTDDEFEQILKDEIDAGRPVMYGGWGDPDENGSRPGHSFVCDGYNSQGLFHINWGWGGKCDGYFLTSLMNSSQPGLYATSGEYYYAQEIVAGIQPPIGYHKLMCDKLYTPVKTATRSNSFYVTLNVIKNYEWTDFSGSLGVAIYDEDGTNQLGILSQAASVTIKSFKTLTRTFSSITIPSTYKSGYYQIVAVYKDTDGVWRPIIAKKGDNYKLLMLTDTSYEFYDDNQDPELVLTAQIGFADNNNVSHQGAVLRYSIKNTGGSFTGDVQAFIYKGKLLRGEFGSTVSDKINRKQSSEGSIIDNMNNNAGKYNMILKYRFSSTDSWKEFEPAEFTKVEFTLLDDELPNLQMAEQIYFDNNDAVPYKNAALNFNISNIGGTFNGNLGLFLLDGSEELGQVGEAKNVTIEKETSVLSSIKASFDTKISEGQYKVALRMQLNDDELWEDIFPTTRSTTSFTIKKPDPKSTFISDTICEGQTYKFNGEEYTKPNVYIWKGISSDGSDSIITLNLLVADKYLFDEGEQRICEGNFYEWRGRQLTTQGLHFDSLLSKAGCDSVYQLQLNVEPILKEQVNDVVEKHDLPYVVGGKIIVAEGSKPDVYKVIVFSEDESCTQTLYNITVIDTDLPTDLSEIATHSQVEIYTILGHYLGKAYLNNGKPDIPLEKGIYILRSAAHTGKYVVK